MVRKPAPDLLADLQDSKQDSSIESKPASNIAKQQTTTEETEQPSNIANRDASANRLQLNARVPHDVLVALGEEEIALLTELGRRVPRQEIIAEALRIGLSDRQRLWKALDRK